MKTLGQDEHSFWKTATPYRVSMLRRAVSGRKKQDGQPPSLAAYFMGG